MKIFVATSNHPSKNSTINKIIKNYIKNLKKIDTVYCIWLLYSQKKNITSKNEDELILDIHNYNNAVEILRETKPDCVLANNNQYSTIDYAFSIAAKFLKIPLIYYKIVDFTDEKNSKNNSVIQNNFKRIMKRVFLKDHETKQFVGSFIIYKNKFLFNTKNKIEKNLMKNIKSQFEHIIFNFYGKLEKRFSNLGDLNIVNNEIWLKEFRKCGIDDQKIIITGNPYWDDYYEIFNNLKISNEPVKKNPIKVLILTTPLLEHGHWSKNQRDQNITKLIEILSIEKDIDYSFKIHPTSEFRDSYEEYIKNDKTKIFQKESFWDICSDFDVVISYGFSMIHIEIALAGYRMILCNFDKKFRTMPMVDSGITSGYIQTCDNLDKLSLQIKNLVNKKIEFDENYSKEVEKYLYKFDGNSGMRAAKAIEKLLKNNKSK